MLLVFVTVAANCCVAPVTTVALAGLTLTPTRTIVTVAEANFVGSATLVAVTVTVGGDGSVAGAV